MKDGSAGTLAVTLLERLGAGAFVAFDRGFVGVGADAQSLWVQVKVSSAPAASSVAPDGGDAFAARVFEGAEFQRHVAGVLDDRSCIRPSGRVCRVSSLEP